MSKLQGLRWKLSTAVAKLRLGAMGVAVARTARFYGQPIVSRSENGVIRIGERVVLVSASGGTALGVRSATVLRTLAPAAAIEIGDDTGLSGAVICAAVRVEIGERCLIGADCMIFDTDFHNHAPEGRRYSKPLWPEISAPVRIEDDVFLGTGTIVCKGVTIGRGSMIGAGSTVTRDIPPMSVAAGSPAKVIRAIAPAA